MVWQLTEIKDEAI